MRQELGISETTDLGYEDSAESSRFSREPSLVGSPGGRELSGVFSRENSQTPSDRAIKVR